MQDLGMGPASGTLGLPDPCEQTEESLWTSGSVHELVPWVGTDLTQESRTMIAHSSLTLFLWNLLENLAQGTCCLLSSDSSSCPIGGKGL